MGKVSRQIYYRLPVRCPTLIDYFCRLSFRPLQMFFFQIVPNLNVMREVDETMVDDHDRTDRSDEPEYVRTVVVCDANDQFMQNVSFELLISYLKSTAS